jgi:regulator of RNase E activity RraA
MQSSRSSERLLHLHSALAPAASATAAGGGTHAAFPPPPAALLEILAGLKDFDSPTIFNAVEKVTGDTTPSKCYTDHTIVNQLAELGSFIGFAVTVECTTNDLDDRVTAGENTFADYYQMLEATDGPLVAVFKDVDTNPGRGASFGDGMARQHRQNGVTGAVVDGTVRDLAGIRRVGLPILAWGKVPGHGQFACKRINVDMTVGDLHISPGDILFGDEDGIVRVPTDLAKEVLVAAMEIRQMENGIFAGTLTPRVFDAAAARPQLQFVELPRVLMLGDSISMGYHDNVVELLAGKAQVTRPQDNCADTVHGLRNLDTWLGDVPQYDVIHFNWGLHDLCYRHPEATAYGKRDKERGTLSVPLEPAEGSSGSWWHGEHASGASYTENLEEIVLQLQQTGAKLIWASSTTVPEGEAGRVAGDEVKYNAAAAELMAKHRIPVNDLHAVSASFGPEMFTAPGDVHFIEAGSLMLAQQVSASVLKVL